jgi:phosphoadenosine phosphosulfate reductase
MGECSAVARNGVPQRYWGAPEVLEEMARWFGSQAKLACSFQKETSVLIDMCARLDAPPGFFTLDTGVLFPETYEMWSELEDRYSIKIEAHRGISLTRQAEIHGDKLWERDPTGCCRIRKVHPLREALKGARGWITGLRREQSPERSGTPKVQWDRRFGLWKANPIADWSEADVYSYLRDQDVPYNELHDRGYASIGCIHCTAPGEGRTGRWPGRPHAECGIHARPPSS